MKRALFDVAWLGMLPLLALASGCGHDEGPAWSCAEQSNLNQVDICACWAGDAGVSAAAKEVAACTGYNCCFASTSGCTCFRDAHNPNDCPSLVEVVDRRRVKSCPPE